MKDSAFKKMLFNQCLDNLAAKGRSAAVTGGTQPTGTQQPHTAICPYCDQRVSIISGKFKYHYSNLYLCVGSGKQQ